jgi:ribulose-5-phosphate 4-epimerase/fuculose-1-phosphate aldolase
MTPEGDRLGGATAVAVTARALAGLGLAHAFGHVSIRYQDGLLISSTQPLADCRPENVLAVGDLEGTGGGEGGLPIELPLHAAIYAARPDVAAICRGHPPAAVAWGIDTSDLPLAHGLGLICGTRVRVHPDIGLVDSVERARATVATLGSDAAVLLQANGALAVGRSLDEAGARLWFLEDRARVALTWRTMSGSLGPASTGPKSDASAWAERSRHVHAETQRAAAWFASVAASYAFESARPTP